MSKKYYALRSGDHFNVSKIMYAIRDKDYIKDGTVRVKRFTADGPNGRGIYVEEPDYEEAHKLVYELPKGWKVTVVFVSDNPMVLDELGTGASYLRKSKGRPTTGTTKTTTQTESPRAALKKIVAMRGREAVINALQELSIAIDSSSSDEEIANAVRQLNEYFSDMEKGGEDTEPLF